MNDKYDGVLKELAALLVPNLLAHLSPQIDILVQAKIDALAVLDKDTIRAVCEEVIDASDLDDKVSDWMQNNWDISDYESEIRDFVDVDDAVERHLNNNLHDQVVDVVQGLKFTVEVSSR
jgi:hypothetical protein